MIRFRDQEVTFANGSTGKNIEFPSRNPSNYFQAISRPDGPPNIAVDGKLFMPTGAEGPLPCVIVAAGSLGVAPSHLSHAETATELGFAAFVLDSFGPRSVTSTVANQTQFSFAASGYDVLAAYRVLASLPEIDSTRIGAQGHSRGGTAVLMSATRRFADAIVGPDHGLNAVYAAYPWSGQQFLDPDVGQTLVRSIMGDADEWCSPMQVQGHMQAIRLSGGQATLRLIGGYQHSFDRGAPIIDVPEASVSPNAPTSYVTGEGAFVHPLSGTADPELMDRDLMLYGVKSGFGIRGAKIGGTEESARTFKDDMQAFWTEAMT
jgi:dienelactone hydrolase